MEARFGFGGGLGSAQRRVDGGSEAEAGGKEEGGDHAVDERLSSGVEQCRSVRAHLGGDAECAADALVG